MIIRLAFVLFCVILQISFEPVVAKDAATPPRLSLDSPASVRQISVILAPNHHQSGHVIRWLAQYWEEDLGVYNVELKLLWLDSPVFYDENMWLIYHDVCDHDLAKVDRFRLAVNKGEGIKLW